MKVLYVSNGFPPRGQWGTEFYTHQLVEGLAKGGVEPFVLHPERDGTQPRYTVERELAGDVPVALLHNLGDPKKSFEDSYENAEVERIFRELIDEVQPDLVHFTYLLWGLSARLPSVAREAGVPVVVTLTDYSLLCHRGQMYDWTMQRCEGPHPAKVCARCVREPSPYDAAPLKVAAHRASARLLALVGGAGKVVVARDLERRTGVVREALAAADHLIAPTRVMYETFQRFGVDESRLTELCYAIDEAPFVRARPEPPRPPHGIVRIGFLGQFTPHKGLGTLLEAVRIMAHRLPESVEPWEVCLYGAPSGGRHKLFAQHVLGSAPAGGRVVVCPPFEPQDAPEVLAALHAVVVPSEWDENAPLTCLQARAAGVPVIGSDVRGVTEVVEHGVHGRIFPMGDRVALADCLREVVLGACRRTGVVELPVTMEEHLERVHQIYEEVLARGAARSRA